MVNLSDLNEYPSTPRVPCSTLVGLVVKPGVQQSVNQENPGSDLVCLGITCRLIRCNPWDPPRNIVFIPRVFRAKSLLHIGFLQRHKVQRIDDKKAACPY